MLIPDEEWNEKVAIPLAIVGATLLGIAIGKVIYDASPLAKKVKEEEQKAKEAIDNFMNSWKPEDLLK